MARLYYDVCGKVAVMEEPDNNSNLVDNNLKKSYSDVGSIVVDEFNWSGHKIADTMSSEALEKYLEIAFELEKNLFLQTEVYNRLARRLIPYKIVEPPIPHKPRKEKTSFNILEGTVFLLSSLVAGFVVAVILSLIVYWLASAFRWPDFLGAIGMIAAILAGIAVCFAGFKMIFKETEKVIVKNDANRLSYYTERNNRENKIIHEEQKKKIWDKCIPIFKQEQEKIRAQYEHTNSVLLKLYAKDVVAPQYRNFASVGSLYEFFKNGECRMMGEAYTLLRQKIQHEQIIVRLDHILSQLEQIKNNQYLLYSTIQDVNNRMNNIIDTTSRLAESIIESNKRFDEYGESLLQNSAITVYCAEQINKELGYLNRMTQY